MMSSSDCISSPSELTHTTFGASDSPSTTVTVQVMLYMYPATGGTGVLRESVRAVSGTGNKREKYSHHKL